MGDILRNSLPSPPLPLRPCDADRPQGVEAVLRRVNTTTVEPEESADPLTVYKPHECGGDKCTFPGCRFTLQLRFSVEKAAIELAGMCTFLLCVHCFCSIAFPLLFDFIFLMFCMRL